MWRNFIVATVGTLFLEGCSISETFQEEGALIPTVQGPAEPTYCANLVPAGLTIVINGTAKLNRRDHFGNTTGAANLAGLGSANPSAASNPGSTHPIRYVEVRVTNTAGLLVACTETTDTGTFSFMLPGDGGAYTISVNSRSQNSRLYASVLNRPDQNKYYSLTAPVIADISKNIGVITAPADSAILAGAFNILDQFLNANEYLVDQTSSCSSTFTGCGNFDPTQYKASAYWMPGFNPNDYFGSGGGGIGFYLPGYQRIFILGGINGNTDSSEHHFPQDLSDPRSF